jgi:Zn-dependent protease
VNWWVLEQYQDGGLARVVSWTFWVLCSIVLHELAHGWAALWQGDPTPRQLGRMTWNPLVHMGPLSLAMFALIGICWGVMPTDPSKYRWKRRGRIVVAAAGPAMNIVLALVSTAALVLWSRFGVDRDPLAENVWWFFLFGAMLNIVLAAFNMLPIPPLDGSGILEGVSMRWYGWSRQPMFQMVGFFLVIVLFSTGAWSLLYQGAIQVVFSVWVVLGGPIGAPS